MSFGPHSDGKPNVLVVLQNAYISELRHLDHQGAIAKFRRPVYGAEWVNPKNATYSRILPYLGPVSNLWFTESTPLIATDPKTKFGTDLEWVRSALEWTNWHWIIGCGKQAEGALRDLGADAVFLPHPVSFAWRKSIIVDLRDTISAWQGES